MNIGVKASTTSGTPSNSNISSNQNWRVQNCNVCKSNQSNRCSVCNSGYQIYSDLDLWELSNDSAFSKATEYATLSSILAWIILEALIAVLSLSSPQGLWAVFNHYQLLMLLLLTGAFFPKEIANFFAGIKQVSFNFSFLPNSNYDSSSIIDNWFNFDINNNYLEIIGMNSGSTIVNLRKLVSVIISTIILQLIFCIFYRLTLSWRSKSKKLTVIMNAGIKFFTIWIYLRLFLQSNQFILICSVYEVNLFKFNSAGRAISFSVAIAMFLFSIKAIILSILKVYHVKGKETLDQQHNKIFQELFSGLKETKAAKYLNTMLMMRRFVFVSFLIFWSSMDLKYKVGILDILQIAWIAYLIIVRPFSAV